MTAGVLDLLSVVGKLSLSGVAGFGEAARLASGCRADDFTAKPLRRDLEGLGHVRCVFGTTREVHVLAPRLCLLPGGTTNSCEAVLVGARTPTFTDELEFICTSCNVRRENEVLGAGLPDRILLKGSHEALGTVAVKLKVDIGDNPEIPDAWRLLEAVPLWMKSISDLLELPTGFDTITAPPQGSHVYDPISGNFAAWEDVQNNYSSRLLLLRKTPYDYRLAKRVENGCWRLRLAPVTFDPLWAMWAVSLAVETECLALPPPSSWTFRVPEGCPLPIELHQVTCVCSGFPPGRANGHLEYQDVPPIIQHYVMKRLALSNS